MRSGPGTNNPVIGQEQHGDHPQGKGKTVMIGTRSTIREDRLGSRLVCSGLPTIAGNECTAADSSGIEFNRV